MRPMLATRGTRVPTGPGWVHEVKWDGVRVIVDVEPGRVAVHSRNENEVTVAFPELAALAATDRRLRLDGELVVLVDGVPSFGGLIERMHVRDATKAARLAAADPASLVAFDLLGLGGESLLQRPLATRRELLEGLTLPPVCHVPAAYDDGAMLLEAAERQGLEGIVSKRLSSRYHPGRRSRDWLKFPIRRTGSYLVGGFRYEVDSRARLGALLLGEPTPDGLRFRGRVGSGVAGRAGVLLGDRLSPLVRSGSPFVDELPRADRSGTVWVDPVLVVDVQYLALTADGRLRQPAYRGIRTDLDPDDLVHEGTTPDADP